MHLGQPRGGAQSNPRWEGLLELVAEVIRLVRSRFMQMLTAGVSFGARNLAVVVYKVLPHSLNINEPHPKMFTRSRQLSR